MVHEVDVLRIGFLKCFIDHLFCFSFGVSCGVSGWVLKKATNLLLVVLVFIVFELDINMSWTGWFQLGCPNYREAGLGPCCMGEKACYTV